MRRRGRVRRLSVSIEAMKKTLPTTLVLLSLASTPVVAQDRTITVIDAAEITWDEDRPAAVVADEPWPRADDGDDE